MAKLNTAGLGYKIFIIFLFYSLFLVLAISLNLVFGDLNCEITTSCSNTAIVYMENETGGYDNAHAQNLSIGNYAYLVCCNSSATLSYSCSEATIIRLYNETNSHVQTGNYSGSYQNYNISVCLSADPGTAVCTYPLGSCSSDYTCMASIASSEGWANNETNAHIGNCNEYDRKICCKVDYVPVVTTPTIVPTGPYVTDNLNCSFSVTDDTPGASLSANYTWYKDGTSQLNGSISVTNNTQKIISLDSGNLTKHQNWTCSVIPYDGTYYGSQKNSSAVMIVNSPPTVTADGPLNYANTTDRTPEFNWTGSDADSDTLTYDLNITCYPSCSNDNRLITGISTANYTPTNYLKYLDDNNFYYNWSVRAYDSENYSSWTTERRVNIQSYIATSMPTQNVSFGEMNLSQSRNTTIDNPSPLVIKNDGNSFINITINSTSLWEAQISPTAYYQFKIDNLTGSSAFDPIGSTISWTNVPTTPTMAIVRLNWTINDSAEIDILVTVPPAEPPGDKESSIVLESSLGE